jgi:hypothetical protein
MRGAKPTRTSVWGGLPPVVSVGHQVWRFVFIEGLSEGKLSLFGRTINQQTEIELEPDQSFGQARDTVLHELQHAIYGNTILHSHSSVKVRAAVADEEGTIRTLTPWLLMLLRDNPGLVEWLMKEENGDD